MSGGLLCIPPEVVDEIVGHFDSARTLTSLLVTCRHFKTYVENHGYRAFIRANFPTYDPPSSWRLATQSLTGLTRCWERRSVLARLVEQETAVDVVSLGSTTDAASTPQRSRAAQSMGCRTMVQCREQWEGGDWRSRIETLYIGAGSELHLRLRSMGPDIEKTYLNAPAEKRSHYYNHFGQRVRWTVFRDHAHKEGKCDITSVLPLPQEDTADKRTAIISRYCGKLEKVTIEGSNVSKALLYERHSSLRFADISPSKQPLVAASNSLHGIRLLNSSGTSEPQSAIDQLSFAHESPYSIVWSCRFLDASRVIIGRESRQSPLGVYELTPSGFHQRALWEYPWEPGVLTCVKTIAPIRSVASGEDQASTLFLSGWMSSDVLLHDVRSPAPSVSTFYDPVDQTSHTYSILPFGVQKFIAGSDRHGLIRFFDMRMPGTRSYSSIDTAESLRRRQPETRQQNGDSPPTRSSTNTHTKRGRGFNLFVRDTQSHSWGMIRNGDNGRRARQHLRLKDSPIYDLAASSPYAASFYAGLVGATLQVDLVSSSDKWPDPTFCSGPTAGHLMHPRSWLDPKNKALRLGLVEHAEKIELYTQAHLETTTQVSSGGADTIDQRWKSTQAGRIQQEVRA